MSAVDVDQNVVTTIINSNNFSLDVSDWNKGLQSDDLWRPTQTPLCTVLNLFLWCVLAMCLSYRSNIPWMSWWRCASIERRCIDSSDLEENENENDKENQLKNGRSWPTIIPIHDQHRLRRLIQLFFASISIIYFAWVNFSSDFYILDVDISFFTWDTFLHEFVDPLIMFMNDFMCIIVVIRNRCNCLKILICLKQNDQQTANINVYELLVLYLLLQRSLVVLCVFAFLITFWAAIKTKEN